ncbi:hypothetical protein [Thermovibrio ammonificans]
MGDVKLFGDYLEILLIGMMCVLLTIFWLFLFFVYHSTFANLSLSEVFSQVFEMMVRKFGSLPEVVQYSLFVFAIPVMYTLGGMIYYLSDLMLGYFFYYSSDTEKKLVKELRELGDKRNLRIEKILLDGEDSLVLEDFLVANCENIWIKESQRHYKVSISFASIFLMFPFSLLLALFLLYSFLLGSKLFVEVTIRFSVSILFLGLLCLMLIKRWYLLVLTLISSVFLYYLAWRVSTDTKVEVKIPLLQKIFYALLVFYLIVFAVFMLKRLLGERFMEMAKGNSLISYISQVTPLLSLVVISPFLSFLLLYVKESTRMFSFMVVLFVFNILLLVVALRAREKANILFLLGVKAIELEKSK